VLDESLFNMKQPIADSHFLGLRTVIYRAPDLEKAREWYSSVLGFGPYFDQPFYVRFKVGGYEPGLDPDASTGSL
jgi:catechol 2,3-dioxygenase-like lactoylglutathione lyase family enzyme